MADVSGAKYFDAISNNKRQEYKLKEAEQKIDHSKRRMLLKFWKEKYDLMDDLVLLHVKTPVFVAPSKASSLRPLSSSRTRIEIQNVCLDSKLLTNKPTTTGRMRPVYSSSPVIDIQGEDAVCYPNKQAKHGRAVHMNYPLRRRLEVAKQLEKSLITLELRKDCRSQPAEKYNRNTGWNALRPKTTGRLRTKGEFISTVTYHRPETADCFSS